MTHSISALETYGNIYYESLLLDSLKYHLLDTTYLTVLHASLSFVPAVSILATLSNVV